MHFAVRVSEAGYSFRCLLVVGRSSLPDHLQTRGLEAYVFASKVSFRFE